MSAPRNESIEYTRLHITPLDESLLQSVISASILPRARNISYHTIETFPEKSFGFVDLPTMDADKLKKKLNGAVLKGTKLRVETARPETIHEPTQEDDDDVKAAPKSKKEKKKSKKRKREANVIEGVELEGRKIKRGWTTTERDMIDEKRKKAKSEKKDSKARDGKKDRKEKRRDVKSKYTDGPECLFKTKLPTAAADTRKENDDDHDGSQKKRRKRKGDGEVIVHEFENTTKYPSFLKSSKATAAAETTTFQDGVGWVDGDGNVVEAVKKTKRPEGIPAPDPPKSKKTTPVVPMAKTSHDDEDGNDDDDDETSSSGSSSSSENEEDTSSDEDVDVPIQDKQATTPKQVKVVAEAISSPVVSRLESARPKSSGSMNSLSIKIPPPIITTTPAAKKAVHPLEALYKRSQDETPNTGAQPFSFFGNEDDEMEDGSSPRPRQSQAMPLTPFTKQDFDFRNIRSAAPTPDTAHPSRSFNFFGTSKSPSVDGEDLAHAKEGLQNVVEEDEEEEAGEQDEQEEDVDMEEPTNGADTQETATSDFQKHFWENRGNLNRAWRKRRKMAAKEKRYRENRARADRAI